MDVIFSAMLVVLILSVVFSMLGLGGASIYVPIFFWLGIPLQVAIISGLFINVISTGIATINYHADKLLDMRAAFWILVGALIGSPIGVWLSKTLPTQIIIGLFSLVLALAAIRMFFSHPKPFKSTALQQSEAGFIEEVGASIFITTALRGAAGGVTGIVSGLLGIGGGIFLVQFLVETGFPAKKAAALSTFVVCFASLFSLLNHAAFGQLDFQLLLATGGAGGIGAFLGSRIMAQDKISEVFVKRAFALILMIFAVKLAYDFFTFSE